MRRPSRMACWPASIVGAFFVILILFDLIANKFDDLPMHSVTGILLTLVFWVICSTLGQELSGAILVVPATFTIIFVLGIWFAKKSLMKRNYCISTGCHDPPPPKPKPTPKCEPPKPKCPPPKPKC